MYTDNEKNRHRNKQKNNILQMEKLVNTKFIFRARSDANFWILPDVVEFHSVRNGMLNPAANINRVLGKSTENP